jgi:hypothetical protein
MTLKTITNSLLYANKSDNISYKPGDYFISLSSDYPKIWQLSNIAVKNILGQ